MIAYGAFALINQKDIGGKGIAFVASGIITIIFGVLMTKKNKERNGTISKAFRLQRISYVL
jgi:hypothetical protein